MNFCHIPNIPTEPEMAKENLAPTSSWEFSKEIVTALCLQPELSYAFISARLEPRPRS